MQNLSSLTLVKCRVQQCQVYAHWYEIDLQNFFILKNWKSLPAEQFSTTPTFLLATILSSVSMSSTTLGTSNKWNHAVFAFL
jgi:hypothetical protein